MADPIVPTVHMRQVQGDTAPIKFTGFAVSVDGAQFTLTHELHGTMTALGVGTEVSFDIDEVKAAAALGSYKYHLVINEGVVGAEQTVCRGRWTIEQRPPN